MTRLQRVTISQIQNLLLIISFHLKLIYMKDTILGFRWTIISTVTSIFLDIDFYHVYIFEFQII